MPSCGPKEAKNKFVKDNSEWQYRATVLRSDIQNLIDYVDWSVTDNDNHEL
jgi:hypothetical protein